MGFVVQGAIAAPNHDAGEIVPKTRLVAPDGKPLARLNGLRFQAGQPHRLIPHAGAALRGPQSQHFALEQRARTVPLTAAVRELEITFAPLFSLNRRTPLLYAALYPRKAHSARKRRRTSGKVGGDIGMLQRGNLHDVPLCRVLALLISAAGRIGGIQDNQPVSVRARHHALRRVPERRVHARRLIEDNQNMLRMAALKSAVVAGRVAYGKVFRAGFHAAGARKQRFSHGDRAL